MAVVAAAGLPGRGVPPQRWSRVEVIEWLRGVIGDPHQALEDFLLLGQPSGSALVSLRRQDVVRCTGSDAIWSAVVEASLSCAMGGLDLEPRPPPPPRPLEQPPLRLGTVTTPDPTTQADPADVDQGEPDLPTTGPAHWSASHVARWLERLLSDKQCTPAEVQDAVQRLGSQTGRALLTHSKQYFARLLGDDVGRLVFDALLAATKSERRKGGRPRRVGGPVARPRRPRRRKGEGAQDECRLWRFILTLLEDPKCRELIEWQDPDAGTFLFKKGAEVARLWGEHRDCAREKRMTYAAMTRAMRTPNGYFAPRPKRQWAQRYVYQFGERANWKNSASRSLPNLPSSGSGA